MSYANRFTHILGCQCSHCRPTKVVATPPTPETNTPMMTTARLDELSSGSDGYSDDRTYREDDFVGEPPLTHQELRVLIATARRAARALAEAEKHGYYFVAAILRGDA